MTEPNDGDPKSIYHATVPSWAALLIAAPLLLVFFSLALTLLTGGLAAAFVLPLFFRRRLRSAAPHKTDQSTIDLDPSEYTRVDSPTRQLPHE
jgi:hypothetical protein